MIVQCFAGHGRSKIGSGSQEFNYMYIGLHKGPINNMQSVCVMPALVGGVGTVYTVCLIMSDHTLT